MTRGEKMGHRHFFVLPNKNMDHFQGSLGYEHSDDLVTDLLCLINFAIVDDNEAGISRRDESQRGKREQFIPETAFK